MRSYCRSILSSVLPAVVLCMALWPWSAQADDAIRRRLSINQGWRFYKYPSDVQADHLMYDVRPTVAHHNENKEADAKPTEAVQTQARQQVLKPWILPSGNAFIKDTKQWHVRPQGNPGGDFAFVQASFDDSQWEQVRLPHDWAIEGPFMDGPTPEVSGGMGRLPSNGVAWYRKSVYIPASDTASCVFLDIDGAMSYAMVWCNGYLVGGWPYGYNSFRLNLTPYINAGGANQLAIRVDNPNYSARWYPGAGLYRNVWLTTVHRVHVAQYGTYITTPKVSDTEATVQLALTVDNQDKAPVVVESQTLIYTLDAQGTIVGEAVAAFEVGSISLAAGKSGVIQEQVQLANPRLWGPPPTQTPNCYAAITTLYVGGRAVDQYQTRFGIRTLKCDPNTGLWINGEHITLKGVNQHHDLGALGTAFNTQAAKRQLDILRQMGCNAIRMAHNPPAPELLELTDLMGFVVINEIFDSWERKKTPHDFHLIFPDWAEPDLRAFVRRDRNSPSIILWSFGNEVGEQYTDHDGANLARRLQDILKEEDNTRPTTLGMNYAGPQMPLPAVVDVIGLNYQGEGIRQEPEFEGTDRIRCAPQYAPFHAQFPHKMIISTETASAASSRGIYLFPVTNKQSAPIREGQGGNATIAHVSAYERYAVDFGSSADKVFCTLDQHPFVAGEFVWNGWDYLGEPTPYYAARSSYTGIIDLAGFPKDRYYLYQSRWRPDWRMVHILPHWNWPQRVGLITPVHVFTSGTEAELFLNGKSLGRKRKQPYQYRICWDSVVYQPGQLQVVAYKEGAVWAQAWQHTTGKPQRLQAIADRTVLQANGTELAFVTIQVCDQDGNLVPDANNSITLEVEGPGAIVATDNGDPTDMTAFPSPTRRAFGGLLLGIIRTVDGAQGAIRIKAKAEGLQTAEVVVHSSQ